MQRIYDSHMHSNHSIDSQQPFAGIIETALEKGLDGISITDHADVWYTDYAYTLRQIAASIADAKAADRQYGDRLRVFCGVELAEYWEDPEFAEQILALGAYDVILSSVHFVRFQDWAKPYSKICFDEAEAPADKIHAFMEMYFEKIMEMAEKNDYDILTHLTCPLRYINGKYHRGVDIHRYDQQITAVLETLIRREKSLEVNASGIHNFYGEWMPSPDILRQYYDMGGRMITLGSDAHSADRITNGFAETMDMLREIGFREYFYYERRTPHGVSLV